jgi:phosphate transport system substrate-binding protein
MAWPWAAAADALQLTSADGALTIEGELLSYDNELFRLNTAAGPITVDGGNLRCSGAGCPDPSDLVSRASVGGPPEMVHRLMPALLEVFADTRGLSYQRIFEKDALASWQLRDAETNRLVAVFEGRVLPAPEAASQLATRQLDIALSRLPAKGQVRQDVIALDALVPIVAPENPRAMVTIVQLQNLLNGRITTWDRLGGDARDVALHLPDQLDTQLRRISPKDALRPATRHATFDALADAVASDPAALGLVPYSNIGNAVPLVVSGACGLATPATRDTIRAEDYPVTEPMFLQRLGARQPKIVRDFIAFARSHEAQPVIRAAGFVDQAVGIIPFEDQGDRIANAVLAAGDDPDAMIAVRDMIASLMTADRLTLTYRFQDGSSDLDIQSLSNIQRLAETIERGDFDGREIVFVGFSDGNGPADGNLRLSIRRAQVVRKAVAALVRDADVPLTLSAFGEALPMACDDTPWGRQVNRRVEVWVR